MSNPQKISQSLLPQASTALERNLENACIFNAHEAFVPTLWNAQTCPEAYLPWLAYALRVDEWETNWSENEKRQACAEALYLHSIRGTPEAIKRALKVHGFAKIELPEWFNYGGEAGYFRLNIEQINQGIKDTDYAKILKIVDVNKNLRSHLEKLTITLTTTSQTPRIGAFALSVEAITLYPPHKNTLNLPTKHFIGAACQAVEIITIYPPKSNQTFN